jgi:hypothetical protein
MLNLAILRPKVLDESERFNCIQITQTCSNMNSLPPRNTMGIDIISMRKSMTSVAMSYANNSSVDPFMYVIALKGCCDVIGHPVFTPRM